MELTTDEQLPHGDDERGDDTVVDLLGSAGSGAPTTHVGRSTNNMSTIAWEAERSAVLGIAHGLPSEATVSGIAHGSPADGAHPHATHLEDNTAPLGDSDEIGEDDQSEEYQDDEYDDEDYLPPGVAQRKRSRPKRSPKRFDPSEGNGAKRRPSQPTAAGTSGRLVTTADVVADTLQVHASHHRTTPLLAHIHPPPSSFHPTLLVRR